MFFPVREPNNQPPYINAKSNQPSTIIRDIPSMINKKMSKETFLNESGYKTTMTYVKTTNTNNVNRIHNIS